MTALQNFHPSSYYIGITSILIGVICLLVLWIILHERSSMKRLIIGLARIGPTTGLQLAKVGYAYRGTVYVDLNILEERGLAQSRWLNLSDVELAARGGIPQREFRLTTKGWSLAVAYNYNAGTNKC